MTQKNSQETPWELIIGGIVLSAWLFNQAPQPKQLKPDSAPKANVSE